MLEYCPAGHTVQLPALAALYVPTLHTPHVVELAGANRPPEHAVHDPRPVPLPNCPAGHTVHDDDPLMLYWPTPHVPLHDVALTAVEYRPAAHSEHANDPDDAANRPAGQPRHTVADAFDTKPAGHTLHCDDSVDGGLYCPAAHTVQLPDPDAATDPSGHVVQFPADAVLN